jgi:hypothetical protein
MTVTIPLVYPLRTGDAASTTGIQTRITIDFVHQVIRFKQDGRKETQTTLWCVEEGTTSEE